MKTNLDEIKLTAYALNELDEPSRSAVEKCLAHDPVARRWVEEVRRTVGILEGELQAEDCPLLTAEQTREIQKQLRAEKQSIWTRQWFPNFRWIGAVTVIAIIAVLAAMLLPALSKAKFRTKQTVAMKEQRQSVQTLMAPGVVQDVDQPQSKAEAPAPANAPAPVSPPVRTSEPVLAAPSVALPNPQPVAPALQPGQPQTLDQYDGMLAANGNAGMQVLQKQPPQPHSPVAAVMFHPATAAITYGLEDGSGGRRFYRRDDAKGYYRLIQPPTSRGQFNTESYASITDNPFLSALDNPLSTFSIDVDTASYANVRRFLNENQLPPPDAVRIEEMINYFDYDYPQPRGNVPFSVNVEVAGCPWNTDHRLVRVGLKGREIARDRRPPSNLVFLIDVSGSMNEPNKLPLLKESLKLLTRQLTENDHVSIVVYAGAAGLVLPETSGDNKATILRALDRLHAGGSTHGSAGIRLAYRIADENFIRGGANRVILCTDGDFNVGVTSQGDLTRLIQDKAGSGVFLSVLGFGMGNYKDSTMEMLADKGNGNYAYIDNLTEGRKVLVEQMSGTLVTIAKDVKIQIEFNPAQVNSYRLIGYENRLLAREDFNDDKKDAGEIGAGHTVTALYEVVPAGLTPDETPGVDPLKYQRPARASAAADSDELMTLKLRYKQPEGNTSRLLTTVVKDSDKSFKRASTDFKFAAAVAEFGMLLRHSPYTGNATFNGALADARAGQGKDREGYRAEFLTLVETARQLSGRE